MCVHVYEDNLLVCGEQNINTITLPVLAKQPVARLFSVPK